MSSPQMTKQTLLFLCLTAFTLLHVKAQEATTAAGGQATGSGGTASYTIGQIVYTTSQGNEGSVSRGLQQSYQISVLGGIENTAVHLDISAYPNPTADYLTLSIDHFERGNYQYQLIDVAGTSLQQNHLLEIDNRLDLNDYKPGIYFCVVKHQNRVIKKFKIIKN